MSLRITAISFLLLCSVTIPALAGSFTIDEFLLTVGIADPSPAGPGFAGNQNPFVDQHVIVQGASSAFGQYDFWWSDMIGVFRVNSELASASADGNLVDSFAEGRIDVTVTEPIEVIFSGGYEYTVPRDQMQATFRVVVSDLDLEQSIAGDATFFDTTFGTGTFNFGVDGSIALDPGNYRLSYSMDIRAFPSSAGEVGSANGFVEFLIIPEPHSGLLLLIAATAIIHRGPRNAMTHKMRAPSPPTP